MYCQSCLEGVFGEAVGVLTCKMVDGILVRSKMGKVLCCKRWYVGEARVMKIEREIALGENNLSWQLEQ